MTLPTGIGSLIAIAVFVLAVVLIVVGQIPLVLGGLVAALAVARLT